MANKNTGLGKGLSALLGEEALKPESDGSLYLPISQVESCSSQPRKAFDEDSLNDLADSIRQHGIIQPLTVRKLSSGYYQIIAGERRWRAARIAGLTEVPAIVIEADDRKAAELAMIENLQREDLNPMEEAAGYRTLIQDYGLTQEEAARRVSKSRPAVANAMRLLALPQEVQWLIEQGNLSAGHGRALLALPTPEAQAAGADLLVKEGWTVARTEKYVEEVLRNQTKGKKTRPPLLIRDVRFFLNSLDHSLAVMRSAGVAAQCQRKEEGEDLLLTIRIPKAKGQSPSGSGPA